MTTAEKKPSIHERMAAVLAGMPAIGKDSFNQGLKFNFRSVEAILNELNPLLEKHGVYLLPEVRNLHMDTRPTKSGQAAVAIVTVAYHFVADDGTEVVAVSVGEGQDSGDKSVSKAMTMALKTCLGQTFAISTEDDPDSDAPDPQVVRVKASPVGSATSPPAENPGAAEVGTPAPPPPPGQQEDPLGTKRRMNYDWWLHLPKKDQDGVSEKMVAAGIPTKFSGHTEAQCDLIASWRDNF